MAGNIKFSVQARGQERAFELRDVDFDEKRDKLALELGRKLIDAAYDMQEGSK